MVTIVLKSGKVFRDVELQSAASGLVQVVMKRSVASGDELFGMVVSKEVFKFQEWHEDEWWVSFNTDAVEGVK